ncbi:MAG: hypothetical protein EZS28_003687 [Streblomastix strix]|uniref:Uncharacterized protein n=1 Tax=Streblomastix strix TaxID=222440 RepID=A0A5J4X145_9EUKA|nr:MAG: hypothetical protein EZS28_003687 [Streblomastix strix]
MIKYYQKLLEKYGKKLTKMQQDILFAYHASPKINITSNQTLKCVSTVGANGYIVALRYTPSLVLDAQILGEHDFCVISDRNVFIYSLIPNVKHPYFQLRFKRISNELKKYPFDIKIYNGLVFEDKQKLDEEEQEYFKTNDGSERFMFNILASSTIPTTNGISFVVPSTFGQYSFFGGIDGLYYHQLNNVNKEIHRPKYQLAAFSALTFDLVSEPQDKKGMIQTSLSDAISLINQIHRNEFDKNQNQQQFEGQNITKNEDQALIHQINNWMHNVILMSACSSTDYSSMQCLPAVKPFVLLSQHGCISCSVPVRYDQTPYRDLGMRTFSSSVSAVNCRQVWTNPQAKIFPHYDEFEANKYRKYVQMEIEEELAESGTLATAPQHSVMRYHAPIFPLRFGRYQNTQILYGISPHPLQCENFRWKTLEPFQIRKAITMMGVEGDVRQRWKLSERERVRKLLNLQQSPVEEKEQIQIFQYEKEKDQLQKHLFKQHENEERKKNLINLLKEIRNKEQDDEVKKRFNQLQLDINEANSYPNNISDQSSTIISTPQMSFLKGRVKSLSTYIYPEITTSNTELTIHQPTMIQLQEQMSPQFQKKNEILKTLTNDTLEHPIPLSNIQRAILQDRLLKLPKEYL